MNTNITTNNRPANVEDNKRYKLAKVISKGYLLGALSISFSHFIHAFNKLGLEGFGAVSMPFAVDGLALFGVLLQHKSFSQDTRKIGRWLQMICGSLSLAVNVYSGWGSAGAVIQGATWVVIYMMMELIVSKIRLASADAAAADAAAIAEAEAIAAAASAWLTACSHPTTCTTPEQCATKTAAADKRRKTAKRNARKAAAEKRVLENMIA